MKTIDQINKELREKREANATLKALLKTENRQMTDDELNTVEARNTEIDALEVEMRKALAEMRLSTPESGSGVSDSEGNEIRKNFSLHRSIQAAINVKSGKASEGFEEEMRSEAEKEAVAQGITLNGFGVPAKALRMVKRAQTVTGQTSVAGDQGGMTVQTDVLVNEFVQSLRAQSGLGLLGARILDGLQGNVSIPFGKNAITATWEGETDTTPASQLNFDKIDAAPKRVSALVPYTKQLLIQSGLGIEQWIRDEMIDAVSRGLDAQAINGSGSGSNPKGILGFESADGVNVVTIGTHGGALTWAKIVELETAVANANGAFGSLKYYTNSKVRGLAKTTVKESGHPSYLWNTAEPTTPLNGYATEVSNNVPSNLAKGTSGNVCSALIFANWQELFLFNWGGVDIIVDPYSSKKDGITEVQLDTFWDLDLRRKGCFGYIKDILTP